METKETLIRKKEALYAAADPKAKQVMLAIDRAFESYQKQMQDLRSSFNSTLDNVVKEISSDIQKANELSNEAMEKLNQITPQIINNGSTYW